MSKAQACAHCGKPDRSLSCSQCKSIKYCDVTCQRAHWSNHKLSCMRALVPLPVSQPGDAPAEKQRVAPYCPDCNRCQKPCQQIVKCGCRRTVYCSTSCRNSTRHDCKVVEGVRAIDERRDGGGTIASAAAAMEQMANNHVLLLPPAPLPRLSALAEQLGAVLDGAEQTRQWMMAAFDARGQHQSHMPQSRCKRATSAAFAAVELVHEWQHEFDQTYAAIIASQDVTDQAQLLRVLTALQDPEFTAQFQDAAAPTQVMSELHVNGIRTKIAQHILSNTVAIRQSTITATLVASGDEVTPQTKADCIERLESAQALLSGLNLPGQEHIRCENRTPRVLTIVLPPELGGGPLRPPVFPVLDMFNLIFSQVVLAIQLYPRGTEDTSLSRWTTFAELVAQPFGEQQGSLLHMLEVLVQRYGDEFRRQISQPGTQLTWERLNASFWREAVRLASLHAGTARVQSIIIDAASILPLAGKHREMGLIFLNWVMYCWRLRLREATVPPLWASCAVMCDGEPGALASTWTPRQEVDFVLARTVTYLEAAGRIRGCRELLMVVRQLQADPSRLDRAMPSEGPAPGEGPAPDASSSDSDEE